MVDTQNLSWDADGTKTTPAYTIPAGALGFYSYENVMTTASGDVITSPAGALTERFVVIEPEARTQISTTTLPQTGGMANDEIVVTGTHQIGATWAVTASDDLYGPEAGDSSGATTWSAPTIYGSWTELSLLDSIGGVVSRTAIPGDLVADGTYRTEDLLIRANDTANYHYYSAAARLTINDPISGDTKVLSDGAPGDQTETLSLPGSGQFPAGVVSVSSPQQVQVGQEPLGDTFDVTYRAMPNDNGTVVATLYGPVAPHNDGSSITNAQFLAAPHTVMSPVPVILDAGGLGSATVTAPSAPTAAGVYGWGVVYTASDHSTATGEPTDANESTFVTQPAMKTQISEQQGVPGDTLKDTINVTGASRIPSVGSKVGVVTATLYFMPVASVPAGKACLGNGAVSPGEWAAYIAANPASAVFSQNLDVTGDGTLTTGGYVIPAGATGCYSYGESYAPNAPSPTPTAITPPGDQAETVDIEDMAIRTQINKAVAFPGGLLVDTINVTDMPNHSAQVGVVTATLYRKPFASNHDTCESLTIGQWQDAIAAGTATAVHREQLAVAAGAQAQTLGYTVPVGGSGCYTWDESFTIPGQGAPTAMTLPGEVTETAMVVQPTVTTKVTSRKVNPGSARIPAEKVADTVLVKNLHGVPVTIEDHLLGPVAVPGTDCSAADFSNATKWATFASIPISKDGQYITNYVAVKRGASGCYTAVESLVYLDHGKRVTVESGAPGTVPETLLTRGPKGGEGGGNGGGYGINAGVPGDSAGGDFPLAVSGSVFAGLILLGFGVSLAIIRHRRVAPKSAPNADAADAV
ncbi:MAG: hypothetical protein FWD74_08840 [Actinomycetia bacterium]|nr:hypothetical protein [Actinomycetes bacterium]